MEYITSHDSKYTRQKHTESHTHLLSDIVLYSTHKNTQVAILSIDQHKAVDRVDHTWLMKTIDAKNIGPNFKTWIEIIYTDAQSHLLINNTVTKAIQIKKSVRQSCPLSPRQYIISIEPMLESIRQDSCLK